MTASVLPFVLPWSAALVRATLLRRRHRFLADVRMDDGREVTAHCVNSGLMEGLIAPGARVWLEPAPGANRKLPFTWVAIELGGVVLGVDTLRPNRLVRAMLAAGALPALGRWRAVHPEFVHAKGSRVDFRLDTDDGPHDVEVKNCHLVYPDGRGYFPDSVSERGAKHLALLARGARRGHRATVLFVVQREDARAVRPSDLHDPRFAKAARRAREAGVRFMALRARPTWAGLEALGRIPVDLAPYGLARQARWRAALKPTTGWLRS